MNLNKLSEIIREYSENMINEHGFYIPLDQYHFIFWKDIVIYILIIVLFIYMLKHRYLKKKLKENIKLDTINYEPVNEKYDSFDNRTISVTIKEAISCGNLIKIIYCDYNNNESTRLVKPERIYFSKGDEYLEGYCLLRNDMRTFKISRMSKITVASGDYGNYNLYKEVVL